MNTQWTTADFDELNWHDCHVYGFQLLNFQKELGASDFILDIDAILEWLQPENGQFRFRIAPATLTFHQLSDLRIVLDYAKPSAGMTPFSLDGIERETVTVLPGHVTYRWRLPINWPEGEISFESPGFTQLLRAEPVVSPSQSLGSARKSLFQEAAP